MRSVLVSILVGSVSLALVSCGSERQLNVVIISLDTTRADRLGAYGYERGTSPAFDALAEASVVFERAYAQSVVTSPSHLSMMLGLRPHSHGTLFNGERLDTQLPTLAERLGEQGYRSGAFVSGVVLAPRLSDISRGFDTFDAEFPNYRRGAPSTTDAALAWLQSRVPGQPYFLFVHYYDAHGPFRASKERIASFRRDVPPRPVEVPAYQRFPDGEGGFIDDLEFYSDAYDAAIQQQDESLERLLHSIDRDRSIVVVTADHGESFDERHHKINHGTYVADEQTRIPLLIHVPGVPASRVDALVETTDLVPTLLDFLGMQVSEPLDGRSVAAAMRSVGETERISAVSISSAQDFAFEDRGYQLDPRFAVVSLVTKEVPRWKLIRYPGASGAFHELYRLDSDPLETQDLADENPELVAALRSRLEGEVPNLGERERATLDSTLTDQLEALGYLQ